MLPYIHSYIYIYKKKNIYIYIYIYGSTLLSISIFTLSRYDSRPYAIMTGELLHCTNSSFRITPSHEFSYANFLNFATSWQQMSTHTFVARIGEFLQYVFYQNIQVFILKFFVCTMYWHPIFLKSSMNSPLADTKQTWNVTYFKSVFQEVFHLINWYIKFRSAFKSCFYDRRICASSRNGSKRFSIGPPNLNSNAISTQDVAPANMIIHNR